MRGNGANGRWALGVVGLGVVALLVPPVSATAIRSAAGISAYTFQPSDLAGGGFQNVAAISPVTAGAAALGGDDSGFHTTPNIDDGGATVEWTATNSLLEPAGLTSDIDLRVASLRWSAYSNTVYAVTGNYDPTTRKGPAGRLLVGAYSPSTGLINWTSDATNHPVKVQANGLTHPRPTGNLIALNETPAGLTDLFVGEADGIFEYRPGPTPTWQRVAAPAAIGGAGATVVTITSLVRDPKVADTLYATVANSNAPRSKTPGLWMLTGCAQTNGCAARPSRLVSGALQAVSVSYDTSRKQTVLITGGRPSTRNAGVWQCIRPNGSFACRQTLRTGNVSVVSLDSVYNPASSSVDSYALLEGAVKDGTPAQCQSFSGGDSVYVSTNDSASFTGATDPTSATVGVDVGSDPWWFTGSPNRLQYLLGCTNFEAGQIAVDPNDPGTVLIASRAGAWRSTNVLAGTGIAWTPVVAGLGASVDYAVSADPTSGNAAQVAVGDADYKLFTDPNHLLIPGQPSQLQPYTVPDDTLASAFDETQASCVATTPSCPLFLGYGDISGPDHGGAGDYTDVFGSSPTYTSLVGTGSLWPTTDNRVVGLAAGTTTDLDRRVLAVLDFGGMYEYSFTSGTWTAVGAASIADPTGVTSPPAASPGARGVPTNFIDVWWPASALGQTSDPDVYVFDPASGLYHGQSTGGDFSWTRIWALDTPPLSSANPHVGHLTGDPSDPNRLYLSYQDRAGYHLVMIDNAEDGYVDSNGNDACTVSPCFARTDLTSALPSQTVPGPMVVDPAGDLYLATISSGSTPSSLLATPPPSSNPVAFTSVFASPGDADAYAGAQPITSRLALSSDCYLYAAAPGGGVSVIVPETPDSCS